MYGPQSKWGALTLIGIKDTKVIAKDQDNLEYETGEAGPQLMVLLCRCGHQFEIEKRMFPGRRSMRDCGREECEYAAGSKRDEEREKEAAAARQVLMDQRKESQRDQAEKRLENLKSQTARRLPGRPLSNNNPGRPITLYVTADEYEAILTYAAKHKVTQSRANGALIQLGANRLQALEELQAQTDIEAPVADGTTGAEPEPIDRPRTKRKIHFSN